MRIHIAAAKPMSNAPASANAPYVSKNLFMAVILLHPENGLKASPPRASEIGPGVRVRKEGVRTCRYSKRYASVFAVDQFFIGVNIASSRRLYRIDGARSKPRRRLVATRKFDNHLGALRVQHCGGEGDFRGLEAGIRQPVHLCRRRDFIAVGIEHGRRRATWRAARPRRGRSDHLSQACPPRGPVRPASAKAAITSSIGLLSFTQASPAIIITLASEPAPDRSSPDPQAPALLEFLGECEHEAVYSATTPGRRPQFLCTASKVCRAHAGGGYTDKRRNSASSSARAAITAGHLSSS